MQLEPLFIIMLNIFLPIQNACMPCFAYIGTLCRYSTVVHNIIQRRRTIAGIKWWYKIDDLYFYVGIQSF